MDTDKKKEYKLTHTVDKPAGEGKHTPLCPQLLFDHRSNMKTLMTSMPLKQANKSNTVEKLSFFRDAYGKIVGSTSLVPCVLFLNLYNV